MPEEAKRRRLSEAIAVYKGVLAARNRAEIGRRHLVLNEGPSLRDPAVLTGANPFLIIYSGRATFAFGHSLIVTMCSAMQAERAQESACSMQTRLCRRPTAVLKHQRAISAIGQPCG